MFTAVAYAFRDQLYADPTSTLGYQGLSDIDDLDHDLDLDGEHSETSEFESSGGGGGGGGGATSATSIPGGQAFAIRTRSTDLSRDI